MLTLQANLLSLTMRRLWKQPTQWREAASNRVLAHANIAG